MSTAYDVARTPSLGPNYRKLWSAAAVSNLADGVFVVALPLIAVSLTNSPALVAGVSIAGRLPWLVFVLVAGALADRLDRRATMRNVQLLRVLVVGLMVVLALADGLSLPVLYVAAFVLGIGETLFDTAAQSIMPNIVPRELLSRANGRLYAVELTMNAFVGPPLGGFLVAISVPLALGGSAIGYGLAALGLALLIGTFKPTPVGPAGAMIRQIRDGLEFLWRNPVLRPLAIMVAASNLAGSAVTAIFVLYVVSPGPMGLDEIGYGLLITSMAVGGVAGSLIEERLELRIGRSNVLFGVVIVSGSVMLIPALTANVAVVGAGMVAMGASFTMWNIITVSLRQRITPDHLLGRMNASYRLFAWGVMPVGALLGGLLAEVLGLHAVFVAAAATSLAMLFFRRYLTDAALDAAEPPEEPADVSRAAT
ncbi:MAG TPA: MFS transporter [Anaerolineae bacterium]|nr:MFS transporter [Anaerolineae bacterium]